MLNPDYKTTKQISFKGRGINAVPDLSECAHVYRLDLTENKLSAADDLLGFQNCKTISFLNLAHNQLSTFDGMHHLPNLQVLNLSHNRFSEISKHVAECRNLKALILNNNTISKIENICNNLSELATLIVSHNKLTEISGLEGLMKLEKISAGHNQIKQFPDLSKYSLLRELKLGDNLISHIPDFSKVSSENMNLSDENLTFKSIIPIELEILDIGNNKIKEFGQITALSALKKLANLNLKGNIITQVDGYKEKILTLIPSLRILDGERFDEKFLERKKKRKALVIKKFMKEEKETRRKNNANAIPIGSKTRSIFEKADLPTHQHQLPCSVTTNEEKNKSVDFETSKTVVNTQEKIQKEGVSSLKRRRPHRAESDIRTSKPKLIHEPEIENLKTNPSESLPKSLPNESNDLRSGVVNIIHIAPPAKKTNKPPASRFNPDDLIKEREFVSMGWD